MKGKSYCFSVLVKLKYNGTTFWVEGSGKRLSGQPTPPVYFYHLNKSQNVKSSEWTLGNSLNVVDIIPYVDNIAATRAML